MPRSISNTSVKGHTPLVLPSKIIIDSNGHSLFAPGRWISGDSTLNTTTPEVRRVLLTPSDCLIDSSTSQVVHTITNSYSHPPNDSTSESWLVGGVRTSSQNNEIFYYLAPQKLGLDDNWKVVSYFVNMGARNLATTPSEVNLRTVFIIKKARVIGPVDNPSSTELTDYMIELADETTGTNTAITLSTPWVPAIDEYAFIWIATTNSNQVTVSGYIDIMRV